MALFDKQSTNASLLPRQYNTLANIQHLERVRPLATSVAIALDKSAKAEGGLQNPMGSGPKGNPSILRRMSVSSKVPKLKVNKPKIHPMKVRGMHG